MKDTEGVLKGRKKVVTPVARASYARLLEPAMSLNDELKYSVSLIFPSDADISEMKQAAANALIDKWGPDKKHWPKGLRSPFRDGNEKDDPLYEDTTFVNVSSTDPPQVGHKIGNKFVELTNGRDVYSGMYIRASLTAFAYDKKGNKGVSFGLGNVLKVRDGERLDGRTDGDTDFKDFEGDDPMADQEGPDVSDEAREDINDLFA